MVSQFKSRAAPPLTDGKKGLNSRPPRHIDEGEQKRVVMIWVGVNISYSYCHTYSDSRNDTLFIPPWMDKHKQRDIIFFGFLITSFDIGRDEEWKKDENIRTYINKYHFLL